MFTSEYLLGGLFLFGYLIMSWITVFRPAFLSSSIHKNEIPQGLRLGIWVLLLIAWIGLFTWYYPLTSAVEFWLALLLSCLTVLDVRYTIVPNMLLLVAAAVWIVLLLSGFVNVSEIWALAVVLLAGTALNGLVRLWKGELGFGWGDIKLAGVLGLYLGPGIFYVIYGAIILGGVVAIFFMCFTKNTEPAHRIPFVPFITVSYLLVTSMDISI